MLRAPVISVDLFAAADNASILLRHLRRMIMIARVADETWCASAATLASIGGAPGTLRMVLTDPPGIAAK
jgi:hypothetical protein